ncbi:MAG: Yip1 domain protein [Chloroflexi bacterium ADurb.Bin325]|nr:MAG: Yip1 domain protein [Chloroflexi bacterium ADurb.Bin325]
MNVPETPQTPAAPPPADERPAAVPAPQGWQLHGWFSRLWDAARLHTPAYAGLAGRQDAFFQGFLIVLLVSLLAGAPGFVGDVMAALQRPSADETAERSIALREMLGAAGPWMARLGLSTAAWTAAVDEVADAFDMGLQVSQEIDQLPTRLPRPVGRILEAFGGWLSAPFSVARLPLAVASLGVWLGYGVWVMLAARLLGGRGSLSGFFGATALYAVPHALDLLRWLPFIGGLIGVIAYIWGVIVYIKATQASHDLSFERALIAVLAPLALAVLIIAGLFSMLSGIVWLRS